jgi:hypothetical protein
MRETERLRESRFTVKQHDVGSEVLAPVTDVEIKY